MRLEVSAMPPGTEDAPLMFRVLLLNDGFMPVEIFQNAFTGPALPLTTTLRVRGPGRLSGTRGTDTGFTDRPQVGTVPVDPGRHRQGRRHAVIRRDRGWRPRRRLVRHRGGRGPINNHETQHVASSRSICMVNIDIYMVNIDPLLARVANAAPGKDAEDFAAAALAAHRATVNWALSIGAFKTAGTNANKRMGTVDTADLASGTYPVNAGPATVTGMAFTNVLKTPAEGMPAPTDAAGNGRPAGKLGLRYPATWPGRNLDVRSRDVCCSDAHRSRHG